MNRKFFTFLLTMGLFPFSTFAGVKVASLNLRTEDKNGYLNISVEGRSSELPELKVTGKTIEINLGKADPFKSISKNVKGAELSANTVNGMALLRQFFPMKYPAIL